MKQHNPFLLPIFTIKIDNWASKKIQLLNLVDWKDKQCLYPEHFTDFHKNVKMHQGIAPYKDKFIKILNKEFVNFANDVGFNMFLTGLWAQRYMKAEHMEPHSHGGKGYSAVLFVDFDPKEHSVTRFVSPFNNPFNGEDIVWSPNDVTEGTLIMFPSMLMHYAAPNTSTKQRTIFSFNCEFQ